MKTLYLLRHAKSSWSEVALGDRERPLAKRGLDDAPRMGRRFAERGETLDQVVASPARRARQTTELFCEAAGFAGEIAIDEDLYFLGPGSIEQVIRAQPDSADRLMLVFHNPDITALANRLDAALRIDNVPTSGLLSVECDIERWRDWNAGHCAFIYFDYPKIGSEQPRGR